MRVYVGWHIVEDEGDAIFAAHIHYAVFQLVVNLIGLAHIEAVGFALDHETYTRVGHQWYMDPVAHMQGAQGVPVGLDATAGHQAGCHGPQ